MNRERIDQRYRLSLDPGPAHDRQSWSDGGDEDIGREVARGLLGPHKLLPCRLLYDETGSELFEAICELPEYYLTRAEDEILARHSAEIAAIMPTGSALFELGSGSAKKTRRLIEAFLNRSGELSYTPIDISRSMLEKSSRSLLDAYPGLSVHAVAGEYSSAARFLRAERGHPKLVLWLGSNVGNLDRMEAAQFLAQLGGSLGARDRLLVGIDRRKSKAVLERAYDDSLGVTARFNLNLLVRINSELGGHFDVGRFRHRAAYDEIAGRIEMHLESLDPQAVRIDRLDITVPFARGERIHTESSYKYSPAEIDGLCRAAGLTIEHTWLDAGARFGLHLLAPVARAARPGTILS